MDTEEAKAITRRGEGQHTEFKKSFSEDDKVGIDEMALEIVTQY